MITGKTPPALMDTLDTFPALTQPPGEVSESHQGYQLQELDQLASVNKCNDDQLDQLASVNKCNDGQLASTDNVTNGNIDGGNVTADPRYQLKQFYSAPRDQLPSVITTTSHDIASTNDEYFNTPPEPSPEALDALDNVEQVERLKKLKLENEILQAENKNKLLKRRDINEVRNEIKYEKDLFELNREKELSNRDKQLLEEQQATHIVEARRTKDQLECIAAKDVLESFKQFLSLSSSMAPEVMYVDETSTRAEVQKADAKMLHTMSAYLMLGINKIRSIHDTQVMNRALITFIRNRRDVLEHPLKKEKTSNGYLEPV